MICFVTLEAIIFLDYCKQQNEVEETTQVVKRNCRGCIRSECALIGGETTERYQVCIRGIVDFIVCDLASGLCVRITRKDELDELKE